MKSAWNYREGPGPYGPKDIARSLTILNKKPLTKIKQFIKKGVNKLAAAEAGDMQEHGSTSEGSNTAAHLKFSSGA